MILIITINVYLTQYLIFLLPKVKNHAFYHSVQEHSVLN